MTTSLNIYMSIVQLPYVPQQVVIYDLQYKFSTKLTKLTTIYGTDQHLYEQNHKI